MPIGFRPPSAGSAPTVNATVGSSSVQLPPRGRVAHDFTTVALALPQAEQALHLLQQALSKVPAVRALVLIHDFTSKVGAGAYGKLDEPAHGLVFKAMGDLLCSYLPSQSPVQKYHWIDLAAALERAYAGKTPSSGLIHFAEHIRFGNYVTASGKSHAELLGLEVAKRWELAKLPHALVRGVEAEEYVKRAAAALTHQSRQPRNAYPLARVVEAPRRMREIPHYQAWIARAKTFDVLNEIGAALQHDLEEELSNPDDLVDFYTLLAQRSDALLQDNMWQWIELFSDTTLRVTEKTEYIWELLTQTIVAAVLAARCFSPMNEELILHAVHVPLLKLIGHIKACNRSYYVTDLFALRMTYLKLVKERHPDQAKEFEKAFEKLDKQKP